MRKRLWRAINPWGIIAAMLIWDDHLCRVKMRAFAEDRRDA